MFTAGRYLAKSIIRFDTCAELMQTPSETPADSEAQSVHVPLVDESADDAASGAEPPPYTAATATPRRHPGGVSSVAEDGTSVADPARISLLETDPNGFEHRDTGSAALETDEIGTVERNFSDR